MNGQPRARMLAAGRGLRVSGGLTQALSGPPARFVLDWTRSLLRAYAQVLFSSRPAVGARLLAATRVRPVQGAAGLLTAALSLVIAHALGRPRAHLQDGSIAFNGLLVGLCAAAYLKPGLPLLALLGLLAFLAVLLGTVFRHLFDKYLGVPILSLPFALAMWAGLLAARRFTDLAPVLAGSVVDANALGSLYLHALGACFCLPDVASGALVLGGLLLGSRWSAILSAVGFMSGWAVYTGLGGGPVDVLGLGFNLVLPAIAIGGIYVVLSPASIVLAAAAAALSALLSAALLSALLPLWLPVLVVPFILVTQMLLLVLSLRVNGTDRLQLVRGTPGSPEQNLARAVYRAQRYPDPTMPLFYPPVMGRWVVTQGPGGAHTHQGLWAHAWDFEVAGDDGTTHTGNGRVREDYHAFGAPVVAAADGRVVRVVAHHRDNPVGEVDTENNWGNLVLLWHGGDIYSLVCHLAEGSPTVAEGAQVVRGQVLGRVGSSGRSPVPHLHFHVQRSAEIGAPTCTAELLHYVEVTPSGRRYVTHGSPEGDAEVEALAVDDGVRAALTFAPGRQWRWTLRRPGDAGAEREEVWHSRIDALGERHLEVEGQRGLATVYSDDRYVTLLDYRGDRGTLLGLLSLGLARVPYTADATLVWEDRPAATPFLALASRIGHEIVLPFAVVGAVATRSRLERSGPMVRVVTELDVAGLRGGRDLPDRIEVTCLPNVGPARIVAWRDGVLRLVAEVTP